MHQLVAAFDPGGTTGYAIARVELPQSVMPTFQLLVTREIVTYSQFYNDIDVGLLTSADKPDVFIIERFNLFPDEQTNQVGSTFPSAEWIGIIRYTLWHSKLDDRIVMQTPSQKARIDNNLLKQLFVMNRLPPSEHIKDAMRHIAFWGLDQRYGKAN